jgi:glyoxylate utilization-related uncharacterized protein
MRPIPARATMAPMSQTIETTTSVTVIHGTMLSFETVGAADGAPLRVREHHETLLRVIDGTITLEIAGATRALTIEGEARIAAGTPHRLWSATEGDARVVQEFRRTH